MAASVDAVHKSSDQINPDQMLIKKKSEYNVKISSDKHQTCYILGICILPSGETIVEDYTNEKVKMLDRHYDVSMDWELDVNPQDICLISPSQVAVTLENSVQFINVSKGRLVTWQPLLKDNDTDETGELPHATLGITYHQGVLYITSGTALYQYTLNGTCWRRKKSLYEDTGGGITVYRCALSPDGDWIYVTNFAQNKLITLTIDGTLISTFTDPELQGPKGLHVTPTGQVLVCGFYSHTVIQVDREGKKKIATLASEKDGLRYPVSICYNTNTDQIIVGLYASNIIRCMEL